MDTQGAGGRDAMTPLLQANGLSKTYSARFPRRDSFDALSDMTFDVRPGEGHVGQQIGRAHV